MNNGSSESRSEPAVEPHRRGKCVHFNGVQNKACEAGVRYADLEKDGHRLPCLIESSTQEKVDGKYVRIWKPWPDVRPAAACSCFRAPTAEEIAADEAEMQQHMDRMRTVMAVVSKWRTWTKKNRVAKQEVIECPACKGRLHLSQAAYNGHVWGKCETEGCVSWMQ